MDTIINSLEKKIKTIKSMMMGEFKEKFNVLLIDKLNITEQELKSEAKFTDLGADSLDMVDLIFEFEKEFFISIPGGDVEKIKTVGEAEEYLKIRLGIMQ